MCECVCGVCACHTHHDVQEVDKLPESADSFHSVGSGIYLRFSDLDTRGKYFPCPGFSLPHLTKGIASVMFYFFCLAYCWILLLNIVVSVHYRHRAC